jgi:methenyltetrahydromethanopterin cyclohydrolase
MVETALYEIELIGFDVNFIVKASGSAPVPPIVGGDNRMMGITNDMIIYGSKVFIYSRGEIEVEKIPSNTSEPYGKPFSDIFKEAGYDFYKINPEIFAPAEVQIKNIETNEIKSAGHINPEVIRKSIGMVL